MADGAPGLGLKDCRNLAAMAGLMKDFFDRTYYPAPDLISGRPYATLICAGIDGYDVAR